MDKNRIDPNRWSNPFQDGTNGVTVGFSFRRQVSHDAGHAGSGPHSGSDPLRDRLAVSRNIRAETEDGSQIQCQGQLRGINHRSTAAQGSSRGSR